MCFIFYSFCHTIVLLSCFNNGTNVLTHLIVVRGYTFQTWIFNPYNGFANTDFPSLSEFPHTKLKPVCFIDSSLGHQLEVFFHQNAKRNEMLISLFNKQPRGYSVITKSKQVFLQNSIYMYQIMFTCNRLYLHVIGGLILRTAASSKSIIIYLFH